MTDQSGKVTLSTITQTPPPSMTVTVAKKKYWEDLKKGFWSAAIILLLGFGMGRYYTYSDIITDCRVLGMFRVGNTPIGCHVGEKA